MSDTDRLNDALKVIIKLRMELDEVKQHRSQLVGMASRMRRILSSYGSLSMKAITIKELLYEHKALLDEIKS